MHIKKNTASAKSIYTHKKRMTEKIYNAYNYIIHIHTHTNLYTYIYTHTHLYIYRYIQTYIKKSSQKIAFNSRFIEFFTFKRCFDTCSNVIRIEKVKESYFLLTNCVNVHPLSDFLRRYFGLIRRVTKSVTICQPPPPLFLLKTLQNPE